MATEDRHKVQCLGLAASSELHTSGFAQGIPKGSCLRTEEVAVQSAKPYFQCNTLHSATACENISLALNWTGKS